MEDGQAMAAFLNRAYSGVGKYCINMNIMHDDADVYLRDESRPVRVNFLIDTKERKPGESLDRLGEISYAGKKRRFVMSPKSTHAPGGYIQFRDTEKSNWGDGKRIEGDCWKEIERELVALRVVGWMAGD